MSIKVKVEGFLLDDERTYVVDDWDEKNNPYLVRWARFQLDPKHPLGESEAAKRVQEAIKGSLADPLLSSFSLRRDLIAQYSFAIPDREALWTIRKHSPNGVLEIGAGTGYWAKLLTAMRVNVVAYDSGKGKYFKIESIRGRYHAVIQGAHVDALRQENHGRTLLLVWPDYERPWADEALHLYRGQVVAYVGEGDGGCTADDAFHQRLEREFKIIDESSIPQWWGIHDRLFVYKRK